MWRVWKSTFSNSLGLTIVLLSVFEPHTYAHTLVGIKTFTQITCTLGEVKFSKNLADQFIQKKPTYLCLIVISEAHPLLG